ncbi:hypothetical protein [Actinobacillus capsulatus]|uniref:hypothetical protein n=1 Tax=Actinobacillus capsulatus TaxID=717 RepID=UPI000375A7DD|nr:hypothetical protein [Actinobacillus capsulatus]
MNFFYVSSIEQQKALSQKFYGTETFAYKLELPNAQGTIYGVGILESGNGFSGKVKGKYEGAASIKSAKRDYLLIA